MEIICRRNQIRDQLREDTEEQAGGAGPEHSVPMQAALGTDQKLRAVSAHAGLPWTLLKVLLLNLVLSSACMQAAHGVYAELRSRRWPDSPRTHT